MSLIRYRVVAALAATVASLVSVPPVAAQDEPVTLRLGVSDEQGRPSDPYVRAFMDEAFERSGGTVVVEPLWNAAGWDGFERGVAHMVVDGTVDLGLAAGRAWDDVGVTSLEALQAPFLITSDALAAQVATSSVAADLLAPMTEVGVEGLAMWPEDLRHPIAIGECIPPVTHPAQLAGRKVRTIPSRVTLELLDALDAEWAEVFEEPSTCDVTVGESGLLQGRSLPGRPIFTGDVTFYPKMQVLAANADSLSRLPTSQTQAIRDAALAVRALAIEDHISDMDAATTWCRDGGRVALAGPEGIAAFEAAARPVLDRLTQDPVTGAAIDAIRAMKAAAPPPPVPVACESALPSFLPSAIQSTLPTLGTWRIRHSVQELMSHGIDEGEAHYQGEVTEITFTADRWHGFGTCGGRYDLFEGYLRLHSEEDIIMCDLPPWYLVWTQEGPDLAHVTWPLFQPESEYAAFIGDWHRISD